MLDIILTFQPCEESGMTVHATIQMGDDEQRGERNVSGKRHTPDSRLHAVRDGSPIFADPFGVAPYGIGSLTKNGRFL